MKVNRITPCRALTIWGIGGLGLGTFTAVLGKQAILTCTASVERTVHRHLNDQLQWLGASDPATSKAIADIQTEELGHLDWAERQRQVSSMGATLDRLIAFGTEALIWLSTYGAAGRMRRDIRS